MFIIKSSSNKGVHKPTFHKVPSKVNISSFFPSFFFHTEGALDQKHWATEYPSCAGKKQSPIDIQRRNVKHNPDMLQLELSNYDAQEGKFLMTNNGHTGKKVTENQNNK